MKLRFRRTLGQIALKLLPDSERLRYATHRPKIDTWIKSRQHEQYPQFDSRTEMYDFVNGQMFSNRPMLYLEFGVFQGESIKYIAGLNSHPDSRYVGFDTFTGLPEKWDKQLFQSLDRQAFDVQGQIPACEDSRVTFVKGLFQDTLPGFLRGLERKHPLLIHIDCDLYSSTLYVLTILDSAISPGTVVMFDEFFSAMHEFRALEDYASAYRRSYEVIAATKGHGQIAIRLH